MVAKKPKVVKKSPLTTVLKRIIAKKPPPLPNTGNNNRFKNFLTQNYLRGLQNVYAITAPKPPGVSQENHNKKVRNFLNHKTTNIPHMLVNKSTFARNLLGRNNLPTLNRMISNKYPYVGRIIETRLNVPSMYRFNNIQGFNNWVNRNNYVFRTWNDNYGMKTVRGPYGPIKLTNIHPYKLSPENLRKLRILRRQNTKNAAEFARKQAAKNAEKRKYVYEISYAAPGSGERMSMVLNTKGITIAAYPPNNATLVPNHNTSHIREYFKRWVTMSKPNYNMSLLKINAYKLKN